MWKVEFFNSTCFGIDPVTFDVNCQEFNEILDEALEQANNSYNLSGYNCTDYGIRTLNNSLGTNIPDNSGSWPVNNEWSNPGDLGEDLRNMSTGTVDDEGGNAPTTNCN